MARHPGAMMETVPFPHGPRRAWRATKAIAPGLALCGLVTLAAFALQGLETRLLGRAWLETLVLAILIGAAVRTAWPLGPRWNAGIDFGARLVLELAVALLGASVSLTMIAGAGLALFGAVACLVGLGIASSYGLGRLFGLPPRMATLIACGNSICGNSAIAAVAPVIGADGEDVTSAIAFTAILGVGVVLGLPPLDVALQMSPRGFGVFAGLTVYAVPQVLAATAPVSAVSVQVGALVKLARVLMLGPVVVTLALMAPKAVACPIRPPLHRLAPWFILAFLGLAAARSAGAIPTAWLAPIAHAAGALTSLSMAGLGLGVDARMIARAGPRVASVVVLSLAVLGALALGLIGALRLG